MQLWRYVLEADRLADLTDQATARDWLRKQPWGPEGELTPHDISFWISGIEALRSLARRLHKRRPRRPASEDDEADHWMWSYVRMMWIGPGHGIRGLPLTNKDLPYLRLFPAAFIDRQRRRRLMLWGVPDSKTLWQDEGTVFWQIVFYQVLSGNGPAVCSDCGELLGELTPKGRTKKQSVCKTCKQRRWRAHQDKEEMRKKEHEQYLRRKKRKHRKREEKPT